MSRSLIVALMAIAFALLGMAAAYLDRNHGYSTVYCTFFGGAFGAVLGTVAAAGGPIR